MDRTSTRLLAAVGILSAGAGLLLACSNGSSSSGGSGTTTSSPSPTESPTPTGSSQSTGGNGGGNGGGGGGGSGGGGGGGGNGGFNSAGRLSDNFSGSWPNFAPIVANTSSSSPFVGTVSVTECTSGSHPAHPNPSALTITVPPASSTTAPPFIFSGGNTDPAAVHVVCARLAAQGDGEQSQRYTVSPSAAAPPQSPGASP
ncbi:hypothetical protein [Kitasatospora acidiphila]|uniref:hypothetical protein n=1 Tax=Kitasatospora acidiphila TaxID=2567942 RepID=UPI003C729031